MEQLTFLFIIFIICVRVNDNCLTGIFLREIDLCITLLQKQNLLKRIMKLLSLRMVNIYRSNSECFMHSPD